MLIAVLPLLKLLGIRILLPNSLKSLARPKASLKMDNRGADATGKGYLNLNELLH